MKAMMGTILPYITFGGSMFGAVYLLLHDKPIQSLAALMVALGSAFGPKIYLITQTPPPAFPVLLPVLPPGRYSTTATSSISTIASGWARRLIWIVVLVGVATPR